MVSVLPLLLLATTSLFSWATALVMIWYTDRERPLVYVVMTILLAVYFVILAYTYVTGLLQPQCFDASNTKPFAESFLSRLPH